MNSLLLANLIKNLEEARKPSAKSDDDRNDWMLAFKKAVNEARRLSALSAGRTAHKGNSGDHSYDLVGSCITSQSSRTYDVITDPNQQTQSTYDVITGPNQQTQSDSAIYSEVGSSPSQPINIAFQYDVIPEKRPGTAVYDTISPGVRAARPAPSPPAYRPAAPPTSREVDNDYYDTVGAQDSPKNKRVDQLRETVEDSGSEDDGPKGTKLNNFLSKFSMESLGSLSSEDRLGDSEDDLSVDELEIDETDAANAAIFPPPQGERYAVEDLKKMLESNENRQSLISLEQIATECNFKFDHKAEYPGFDALKKFLQVTS